jgi:hypothetical protein
MNYFHLCIIKFIIGNALQQILKDTPTTTYRLLQTLDNLADFNLNLR